MRISLWRVKILRVMDSKRVVMVKRKRLRNIFLHSLVQKGVFASGVLGFLRLEYARRICQRRNWSEFSASGVAPDADSHQLRPELPRTA
nr:hypothetical protein Iba_chr05cCG0500 [Ipomoea batatas]